MIFPRWRPLRSENCRTASGHQGDGSRIYVGLENADGLTAIDTLTNKVIATSAIGQAPQAIVYVPNAVPGGAGTQGLQPRGLCRPGYPSRARRDRE